MNFFNAVATGVTGTDDALAIFDKLDPVGVDFMLGSWKGASFPTGHALDGVLEAFHWHGKRFDTAEHVHPLVFSDRSGRKVNLNPALMPFVRFADRIPIPKSKLTGSAFQRLLPLLTTSRSRARLRMMSFRGKESAAMIYDDLPIHDIFRRMDDNTVLGIMDCKGMAQPFFFILRREQAGDPSID